MKHIVFISVLLLFAKDSSAQTFRADTRFTPTFIREISQPRSLSSHANQTAYPRKAAREGAEGNNTIGLQLRADGSLIKNYVIKSSGHIDLDRAALTATSVVYARPMLMDGVPVEGLLETEYVWRLE